MRIATTLRADDLDAVKRSALTAFFIISLVAGSACAHANSRRGSAAARPRSRRSPTPAIATRSTAVCGAATAPPAHYDSVVVFAFENRDWTDVGGVGFGTKAMPYLASLARRCAFFDDWTQVDGSQTSLTQYTGQVTGARQSGTVNDCTPSTTCSTTANNIFRQARAAGRSAVNYVEGATQPCSASGNAVRHVPALYMWNREDRKHCSDDVRPYGEFNPDKLPNFGFITPTPCHDGHDCDNTTVDEWARANIGRVLDSHAYRRGRVAVFVWYDESRPVPNLWITPSATPGRHDLARAGYAGTLAAWESMLQLPCLANACTAPDMRSVAHS